MSKKHKIGKIENLKKDHGIDLGEVIKTIVTVTEMYDFPYHMLRSDYEYLEDCEYEEFRIEYYFVELLERLCWMEQESYTILRENAFEELIELLTKTIDMWDKWIDKRAKLPEYA